jgi:membrane protein
MRVLSGVAGLVTRSTKAWFSHDAASVGASLSFYTLFSLAPVLLVATWVAGLLIDKHSVQLGIVSQMRALMGDAGAAAIGELLEGSTHFGNGFIPSFFGVLSLLIGATSVFAELQRALDRVWDAPSPEGTAGVWRSIRTRILSFGLILGVGFLLLVSLVVSAALAAVSTWMGTIIEGWKAVLFVVDILLGLGIAAMLFAMIFKFLPHESIPWGDVWVGALVTAALFTIGKIVIGVYLSKSAFTSGYGAPGSLLVLLLWIYYSAQIFLFGAEFTHALARAHVSQQQNA